MSEWNLNYLPLKSLIRPRRNNVSKNWKSCDGQKPSEGSNPSHCAKKKSTALRCFSFWVPVQTDISIRMEGKSLDKHST